METTVLILYTPACSYRMTVNLACSPLPPGWRLMCRQTYWEFQIRLKINYLCKLRTSLFVLNIIHLKSTVAQYYEECLIYRHPLIMLA